ncbi:MAG: hypothetical protein AAGM38_09625 [Pseudomonadota bacterium]
MWVSAFTMTERRNQGGEGRRVKSSRWNWPRNAARRGGVGDAELRGFPLIFSALRRLALARRLGSRAWWRVAGLGADRTAMGVVGRRSASLLVVALLGSCASIGAPITTTFAPSEIEAARLVQPPRPPKLVASDIGDLDDVVSAAAPDRLASWMAERGARRFEGPQIPFFFESELGRAYARSGPGRAIARGEPADRCPLFGAALDGADPASAARGAMRQCLSQRSPSQSDCACRLLAADQVLFAPPEAFAYARAVSAKAIPLDARLRPSGPPARLIAEERFEPRAAAAETGARASGLEPARREALALGARRLWLIGLQGPVAGLDLQADGAARLTVLEGPRDALRPVRELEGRWEAEGFRRGRLAERVALRDEAGEPLLLLIGYEPAEMAEAEARLLREAKPLFAKTPG